MNLTWKRVYHQGEYVNSQENIIKRKQFAFDIIGILNQGKIILNYDESIIGGTTS